MNKRRVEVNTQCMCIITDYNYMCRLDIAEERVSELDKCSREMKMGNMKEKRYGRQTEKI